jgi:hypothetical protein
MRNRDPFVPYATFKVAMTGASDRVHCEFPGVGADADQQLAVRAPPSASHQP